MNIVKITTVAAAAILLSACASITRGTHEVLQIETDPSGANVALSIGESCVSPCSLKLKRKDGLHVSIVKDGYHTVETDVNTQIASGGSAGMAGNILLGGFIGAGIDASSGALNEFTPNPLKITLVPLEEDTEAAAPVIAAGESFHFKTYAKNGEKVPLDKKERKIYLAAKADGVGEEVEVEVAAAESEDAADETEAVVADAEALASISTAAGGDAEEIEKAEEMEDAESVVTEDSGEKE